MNQQEIQRHDWLAWQLPLMALGMFVGIAIGRGTENVPLAIPAMIASLAACLFWRGTLRAFGVMLLTVAIGTLLGYQAYHLPLPQEDTYWVTGPIAQEVRFDPAEGHVTTVLRDVTLNGEPYASGAYWSFYLRSSEADLPEGLLPGAQIQAFLRLYHPADSSNPEGFNFREKLLSDRITIGLYGGDQLTLSPGNSFTAVLSRFRHTCTVHLQSTLGQEAGSYAAAMLLGNRTLLPQEELQAFQRLGIAHILSVSGFHVGVLMAILSFLLRPLGLPRLIRTLLLGGVLAVYAILTGLSPSVVRAGLLCMAAECGTLFRRQTIHLHLLSLAAVCNMLLFPAQAMSSSFQLSYGALLGLILVQPTLRKVTERVPKILRGVTEATCASFSAQFGLLLPQLYWFQEVPLLGFILNGLVLMLSSVLMILFWLMLPLGFVPVVGPWIGGILQNVVHGLLEGVQTLSALPGTVLQTPPATFLTVAGWVLCMVGASGYFRGQWKKVVFLLGTGVICLSFVFSPAAESFYVQLDVGNADAGILQDGGEIYIVDTGETGEEVFQYLKRHNLTPTAMLLSHFHSDHVGGVRRLLQEGMPIPRCYVPAGWDQPAIDESMRTLVQEMERAGVQVIPLSRGDTVPLPHGQMTVLWPEEGKVWPESDPNDFPLVMAIQVYDTTLLMTGDLSGDYEHYIAPQVDILKAAHHGSKASSAEAYLEQVQPRIILLSNRDENREEAFRERAGEIPVYSTLHNGAVTIRLRQNQYTVIPHQE